MNNVSRRVKDERTKVFFDLINIIIASVLIIIGLVTFPYTALLAPFHHGKITVWDFIYTPLVFWSIILIASISALLYGAVYTKYREVRTWGRKYKPKSPKTRDYKGTTTEEPKAVYKPYETYYVKRQ